MIDIYDFDALIGFGKPASKTADWIVNTYLPNSPVSHRLSIEHAIAEAIVEGKEIGMPPKPSSQHTLAAGQREMVGLEKLMGLIRFHEKEHRSKGDLWWPKADAYKWCADELEAALKPDREGKGLGLT